MLIIAQSDLNRGCRFSPTSFTRRRDTLLPEVFNGPCLQNLPAERRKNELGGEACGLVALVLDRVHLGDVHAEKPLAVIRRLGNEVRLAVGEAAADGRADPGRLERVDAVDVVREVESGRAP